MQDGRELPGFKKKSFALPFGGGEIWFEHLDGMYGYCELVLEKLSADMPVFQRPSAPSNIGFVLDETDITDGIIDMISASLLDTQKRFMRVAFIGADRRTAKLLKKRLYGRRSRLWQFRLAEPSSLQQMICSADRKLLYRQHTNGFALCFFSDFEKAKQWLVSEGM